MATGDHSESPRHQFLERVFDVVCEGFANSEYTVSKVGDRIFVADDKREWSIETSLWEMLDQR